LLLIAYRSGNNGDNIQYSIYQCIAKRVPFLGSRLYNYRGLPWLDDDDDDDVLQFSFATKYWGQTDSFASGDALRNFNRTTVEATSFQSANHRFSYVRLFTYLEKQSIARATDCGRKQFESRYLFEKKIFCDCNVARKRQPR